LALPAFWSALAAHFFPFFIAHLFLLSSALFLTTLFIAAFTGRTTGKN
jgi:hypothetical protein